MRLTFGDKGESIKKIMYSKSQSDLVFGLRPVIEAIKAGKEFDKIILQKNLGGESFKELKDLIHQHNIPYQVVPIEKLNRVTRKNHQGVIAFISVITYQPLDQILFSIFEKGKIPLFLILDRITDVRNFGAISRTCECAGVDAIIIPDRGAAQINADAIKTSAGALLKIPVCREKNLKTTIDFLKDSGLQIISCTEKKEDKAKVYYQLDFSLPTAIIMGSEEDGISDEYLKKSDAYANIPILGNIESLNVSVAAGIVLYETVKQRQA